MRIICIGLIGIAFAQPPLPTVTVLPPPPATTTQAPPNPQPTTTVAQPPAPTTQPAPPPTTTRTPPSAVFTPNPSSPTSPSVPLPTTSNINDQQGGDGKGSGLGIGIIAAIVIGAIILVFGLVSYAVNVYQKRKKDDSTLLEMTGNTIGRSPAPSSNATKLFAANTGSSAGLAAAVNQARKNENPMMQSYGNQGYSGNASQTGGSQVGYSGAGASQVGAYGQVPVSQGYLSEQPGSDQFYSTYYDPNQQMQAGYDDQQYGEYQYTQEEIDEWNRQQAEYAAMAPPPSAGDPYAKPLPRPQ